MAARLPTVGGDNNSWGTVLNDYLQQALASDGTLVTVATNPYTGLANTNLASATKPGLVQLAGDLTGTAASPALASVITAGSAGDSNTLPVITYDAKGRLTAVTPTNIDLASTTTAGLVQLAGDLAGTSASPALKSIITAGSIGNDNVIPIITYDTKGRITAVTSTSIPCFALAANKTTTSNAASATNLAFAAAAGDIWTVEYHLTVQCSNTGGVKYSITAPTGSTVEGGVVGPGGSATTIVNNRISAINTLTGTATNTQATTPLPVRIWVTVTVGGTAGNIGLSVASGTNGQTSTIFAKSWVSAQAATTV